MGLSDSLTQIKTRIRGALSRSRFGVRDIYILGASKDQSLNKVREAFDLGIVKMGENYAQELLRKAPLCSDMRVEWHFIGRLQSNKMKHILPHVYSIDSVDSVEHAQRISRLREQLELGRAEIPIMIQVNVGQERQKSGLPPAVVEQLFSDFTSIPGVSVTGLMSIPPAYKDPEKSRPHFQTLKTLFDGLREKHPRPDTFRFLSMGMSQDFEIALEEGANFIRLGSCLFGPRPNADAEKE